MTKAVKPIENEEVVENVGSEDEILSIAQEANKLIAEKEMEVKKLKVKLARYELTREMPQDEQEQKEEKYDLKKPLTSRSTDYDICMRAIKTHEAEMAHKNLMPVDSNGNIKYTLGAKADDVYSFLKECADASNGDPKAFHSIYITNLPDDSQDVKARYKQAMDEINANNAKLSQLNNN